LNVFVVFVWDEYFVSLDVSCYVDVCLVAEVVAEFDVLEFRGEEGGALFALLEVVGTVVELVGDGGFLQSTAIEVVFHIAVDLVLLLPALPQFVGLPPVH